MFRSSMRSSDGRLGYVLHSQEKLTPEQKQMARRRRILQGRAAQGICILAAFAAISLFAAGWLLLPYLAWVTFAGYLNLGVYILNR